MKKYGKEVDKNILMNKLLREHDELNYISYHNCTGDEFDMDNLDEENIEKIKYLIPIFKTIFIERLIIQREKMDIRRIYILTERELIIYPPEDPSKIDMFSGIDDDLILCSWEPIETYYSCIFTIL